MATKVQPTQGASQSFRAQLADFRDRGDNLVYKVAKFVFYFFGYPFALIGDVLIGAKNLLFGKKEETVELSWYQKFKNRFSDAWNGTKEFGSNHKTALIWSGVGLAALGTTYYFGGFSWGAEKYKAIMPTWLGGRALETVPEAAKVKEAPHKVVKEAPKVVKEAPKAAAVKEA